MSTTVKFTNYFGSELITYQLESISSYYKTFFEDIIPIKKERYENNELVNTSYFVSSIEAINDILLIEPNSSFDYRYIQNNFNIKESLAYQSNFLVDRFVSVYDNDGKVICFRKYDIQNEVTTINTTEKYYYIYGKLKYTFDYKSDGSCFIIIDEQDFQSDIYAWGIGDTDYTDFTWPGFEYYEFAEPLIPNN